jgi:hypothetical protein
MQSTTESWKFSATEFHSAAIEKDGNDILSKALGALTGRTDHAFELVRNFATDNSVSLKDHMALTDVALEEVKWCAIDIQVLEQSWKERLMDSRASVIALGAVKKVVSEITLSELPIGFFLAFKEAIDTQHVRPWQRLFEEFRSVYLCAPQKWSEFESSQI